LKKYSNLQKRLWLIPFEKKLFAIVAMLSLQMQIFWNYWQI